jgi:hypothetical protein
VLKKWQFTRWSKIYYPTLRIITISGVGFHMRLGQRRYLHIYRHIIMRTTMHFQSWGVHLKPFSFPWPNDLCPVTKLNMIPLGMRKICDLGPLVVNHSSSVTPLSVRIHSPDIVTSMSQTSLCYQRAPIAPVEIYAFPPWHDHLSWNYYPASSLFLFFYLPLCIVNMFFLGYILATRIFFRMRPRV